MSFLDQHWASTMADFAQVRSVLCFENAVALITFKPNSLITKDPARTVILCACVLKNFDLQLDYIMTKVDEMRSRVLPQEHTFYLGSGFHVQIHPDYNTITIRKYVMNGEILYPSTPAFTFQLDEFDEFCSSWASMAIHLRLHDFTSTCSPLLPCISETCDYCKMLPSLPRVG